MAEAFKIKTTTPWKKYVNAIIAAEISTFAKYYDQLIQWKIRPFDSGLLFDQITCPQKIKLEADRGALPNLKQEQDERSIILLNGTFNHHHDIQGLLLEIKKHIARSTRIVAVTYNPYFKWIYKLANLLKLRKGEAPDTFLTNTDLNNLALISGYSLTKIRPCVYFPFEFFGIGNLINKILPAVPLLRWISLTCIIVLRPIIKTTKKPSLSIVIPARNEEGNIENALKRMEYMSDIDLEIIFVEGHSSDNTWATIKKYITKYKSKFKLQAFQQSGKGKNDAVRLGFSKATGELLTILDADLTMPPELLYRFYQAYLNGTADFVNGSRLLYPMEGEAMRFLNRLGNIFFAKKLSFCLDTNLSDSLCGTKLLRKSDYGRILRWRDDFGDFDPFGDFELLFPAAILALGVCDIPIRYLDRTYGSTNISRFYHGLMLLKMTMIGFFKVKLGKVPRI